MTNAKIWKSSAVRGEARSYLPSILAAIGLLLLGEILNSGFASRGNIIYILTIAGLLAITSFGQSIIMFAGNNGIDLTVGPVMTMGALLGAQFSGGTAASTPKAILLILLFAACCGFINGVGVQFLKIPAMAMTLIMATVVSGFVYMYTKGMPRITIPKFMLSVGRQSLPGGISPMIVIALVMVILLELFLRKTRFGRSIYLVGSNRTTAHLCGINVNFIAIAVYVIGAMISAIAGFLLLGYTGSGSLDMGETYTMQTIAAVVVGGAKAEGGKGSLIGTTLGSIVMTLLNCILIAVGLQIGVRRLFQGAILLGILLINNRGIKLRQ